MAIERALQEGHSFSFYFYLLLILLAPGCIRHIVGKTESWMEPNPPKFPDKNKKYFNIARDISDLWLELTLLQM